MFAESLTVEVNVVAAKQSYPDGSSIGCSFNIDRYHRFLTEFRRLIGWCLRCSRSGLYQSADQFFPEITLRRQREC